MSSSTGATVLKRFLVGMNDDYVNTDFIHRIYWSTGKLMADMGAGPPIQLKTKITTWAPGMHPADIAEVVSM
jgi:hypothetical protein